MECSFESTKPPKYRSAMSKSKQTTKRDACWGGWLLDLGVITNDGGNAVLSTNSPTPSLKSLDSYQDETERSGQDTILKKCSSEEHAYQHEEEKVTKKSRSQLDCIDMIPSQTLVEETPRSHERSVLKFRSQSDNSPASSSGYDSTTGVRFSRHDRTNVDPYRRRSEDIIDFRPCDVVFSERVCTVSNSFNALRQSSQLGEDGDEDIPFVPSISPVICSTSPVDATTGSNTDRSFVPDLNHAVHRVSPGPSPREEGNAGRPFASDFKPISCDTSPAPSPTEDLSVDLHPVTPDSVSLRNVRGRRRRLSPLSEHSRRQEATSDTSVSQAVSPLLDDDDTRTSSPRGESLPAVAEIDPFHSSDPMELWDRATLLESQGKFRDSLACYKECLRLNQLRKTGLEISAAILHRIGVVRWKAGDYKEGLEVLLDSLERYNHCFRKDSEAMQGAISEERSQSCAEALSEVMQSIGKVQLSLGDLEDAEFNFRQALHILKVAHLDGAGGQGAHPAFARAAYCLGLVFDLEGRGDPANMCFEKALAIQKAVLGRDHVDVAATLRAMGALHEKSGRLHEAKKYHERALHIYRVQLGNGSSPVDIGMSLSNVAWIHYLRGRSGKALKMCTNALEITKAALGEDHRNTAAIEYQYGVILSHGGENSQALRAFKKALQTQRVTLGDHHEDVALTLEALGMVYVAENRMKKAIKSLTAALRIRQQTLGENHVLLAMLSSKIGLLYIKVGEMEYARVRLTDAMQIYEMNNLSPQDYRLAEVDSALKFIDHQLLEESCSEELLA